MGSRPPRLAHRVLGDGGGPARRRLRHPRRRPRPAVPPSRERGGADALRARRRARAASGCTTACSPPTTARRCRSRSATSRRCTRRSTRHGRDALVLYFASAHYRQPIVWGEEPLAAAAASVARIRDVGRRLVAGAVAGRAAAAARPLLRGARRRLPHARGARGDVGVDPRGQPPRRRASATATCARCSACSRSRTCSTRTPAAPEEVVALATRAPGRARRRATTRAPTSCERRSRRSGWSVRDTPGGGFELTPLRMIVYGRNAVREALRGRRAATVELDPRHRGGRARALARRRGASRIVTPDGDRGGLRLARAPGHLRRARRLPVRLRRASCSPAEQPLIVALDEVQDPAEPRRDLPHRRVRRRDRRRDLRAARGRGHRGGLPGLGRRRRASADRAGAQPRGLPARGAARGLLVLRRRGRRRRRSTTPSPTTRGGVVVVFGAEGHGLRRRVARAAATRSSRCRCAARSARSTSTPRPARCCTKCCAAARPLDSGSITAVKVQREHQG